MRAFALRGRSRFQCLSWNESASVNGDRSGNPWRKADAAPDKAFHCRKEEAQKSRDPAASQACNPQARHGLADRAINGSNAWADWSARLMALVAIEGDDMPNLHVVFGTGAIGRALI